MKDLVRGLTLWLLLTTAAFSQASGPKIEVIYPKEGQDITAFDSTFILGNVTADSKLKINGFPVEVYPNGAFLAFLPIQSGDFKFELVASHKSGVATSTVNVRVPERLKTTPADSFRIEPKGKSPRLNLVMLPGDLLEVKFRGTPNCRGMFKIDGLTDWIEMAETRSGTESQNSRDVFSLAGITDTVTGEGAYSGLYRIEAEDKVDSAKIRFRLVKSISSESESLKNYMAYSEILHHLCPDSVRLSLCAVDSAEGNLTIYDASVPQVVDLTDTSQISARTGPGYLYWYLFQSAGTKAIFAGKAGKWVKLKLTETDFAWIEEEKVKFLPRGTSPPFSRVTYLRTNQTEGGVKVTFSMSQRLPFRIQQASQPSVLTVDIFYATADAGFTRYDSNDRIIKQLNWSQPGKDHFQAQILFRPNQQWGYKAYYEGANLVLEIKSEPELGSKLDGLTVMVDPGHSPDPGSTGPTGLKEKDVNLSIAKKLRDILRKHGANVVMTRSGDDNVPLYDRPKLAEERKADIFVSVHNNAHPDGVNPLTNTGTSVYYYHPQSQRLAECVHREMVQHLEIGDQGLYAGNFAVLRPTGYLSILVECAFIIHPEQEVLLREAEFQEKIAKAIYQGLEAFLKEQK